MARIDKACLGSVWGSPRTALGHCSEGAEKCLLQVVAGVHFLYPEFSSYMHSCICTSSKDGYNAFHVRMEVVRGIKPSVTEILFTALLCWKALCCLPQRSDTRISEWNWSFRAFQSSAFLLLKALSAGTFIAVLGMVALSVELAVGKWCCINYVVCCGSVIFISSLFTFQLRWFFSSSQLPSLACLFRVKLCSWLKKFLCGLNFKRLSLGPMQFSCFLWYTIKLSYMDCSIGDLATGIQELCSPADALLIQTYAIFLLDQQ